MTPSEQEPYVAEIAKFFDDSTEELRTAGHVYVRDGMVKNQTYSGRQLQAVVSGRTDYRVSLVWNELLELRSTCTCPAHRRQSICKHVIALVDSFINHQTQFQRIEESEIPPGAPPAKRRRDGTAKQRASALKNEQQKNALLLVDRVLEELTAGGLAALGTEQRQLLTNAAETIRGLKLRRLGNLMIELINLVSQPVSSDPNQERFAALLSELFLMREIIGAHLDGRAELDPDHAARLLGKTWRATELSRVEGLELVGIAEERVNDGEFQIDSLYLMDTGTGAIFVERAIMPIGLRGGTRASRRLRYLADSAGIYPSTNPTRIRLDGAEPAELTTEHIHQILGHADRDLDEVRDRLLAQLDDPTNDPETIVVFRPTALIKQEHGLAALDRHRRALRLSLPETWGSTLWTLLPQDLDQVAFVGFVGIDREGPRLRCLSCVGDLRWPNGPTFPGMT